MDVHSPEQRSYNMSQIKGRDTKPEMIVRRIVHRMGFRFRLHNKNLAGKPDLVFARHKKIIFVHGCFFHMHHCAYGSAVPKTRPQFWNKKRLSNVERDKRNIAVLEENGWTVLCIWECMTKPKAVAQLPKVLARFLGKDHWSCL
jgi:DNA mismatch endonuclease (patch repair protein)